MHQGNLEWLAHAQQRYGHRWMDGAILEIGSLDINGSARAILKAATYVGVDRVSGRGVDVACDAATYAGAEDEFACLLCCSVLEHTPAWKQIILHNLRWLQRGGVLLLSWGAEGNQHHAPEPWAFVPVGDVLELVAPACDVIEAYWERSRFTADCAGCYDLIAIKR